MTIKMTTEILKYLGVCKKETNKFQTLFTDGLEITKKNIDRIRNNDLPIWLQRASLENINLEGANLEDADLYNINLEGATLRDANLKKCKHN